jgi:hypothetical protein
MDRGRGSLEFSRAYERRGTLWTTFEVTPTSGPDAGTPNVHWAELNVSDPSNIALITQGTISGSVIGAGVGTETGSVAVDGAGDVIMNFVATGPNLTPTDYFETKFAGSQFSLLRLPGTQVPDHTFNRMLHSLELRSLHAGVTIPAPLLTRTILRRFTFLMRSGSYPGRGSIHLRWPT